MVAGPYKKARPAQDCQEEEKIAVVRPIVPKGLKTKQNKTKTAKISARGYLNYIGGKAGKTRMTRKLR